jgi:monofunctional glycosyltransferase
MARKSHFKKNVLLLFAALVVAAAAYCAVYPDVGKLKKENPKKTAMMEYREREWRREGRNVKMEKKWASLSKISPYLLKAVIIAEDDKFWSITASISTGYRRPWKRISRRGLSSSEEAP